MMQKRAVFHGILLGHFECIQSNTANLLKLSTFIIDRKELEINGDVLKQEVMTNDIDGRMFDKTDRDTEQHLRQLYTALRKWRYVEPKVQSVEKQKEEQADDSKVDESERVIFFEPEQPPDVYEIGRRFYFWHSHRKDPDFVAPKYENIKEEVFSSSLFGGLITIGAWNTLTALIETMIGSDAALKISSNGQSEYMYNLKRREPVDANHLRSLKLYTDFTDLSAKFCAVLRLPIGLDLLLKRCSALDYR